MNFRAAPDWPGESVGGKQRVAIVPRVKRSFHTVTPFLPARLGEFPDSIGNYLRSLVGR